MAGISYWSPIGVNLMGATGYTGYTGYTGPNGPATLDIHYNSNGNILTASGQGDYINGQPNLTFDGSILSVNGGLKFQTTPSNITSNGSGTYKFLVLDTDGSVKILQYTTK